MRRRNGQVALFVLLGVALLILLLLVLLLRRPTQAVSAADAQRVAPVTELVTSCTTHALEHLLRQAGANGGYLDTAGLRRGAYDYDSDVVSFPPQEVAYWSHVKRCDAPNGCEASEQPPLCKTGTSCPVAPGWQTTAPSLQEQLEAALPAAVDDCLDGFASLPDFTVERKGTATAKVLFSDTVIAQLDMPVLVTDRATGTQVLLKEFTAEANLNLPQIYRLASSLADAERQTSFLERLTLQLLSVYSGVDTPLPPMREISILGQKRYWTRSAVARVLQEDVLPWTDFIQVPNALAGFAPVWPAQDANLSAEEQRMYAGIFSSLYVRPDDQRYPGLAVRFFYPGSEPYLSINGGQELLTPRSADIGGLLQKIVGLFLNDYRFRYDLAYPVIVTITDPSALDGQGYAWSFALEADIRRNEPLNRSAAAQQFTLLNDQADLTSPLQRVDNTIQVATYDKETGEPLPLARVSYACGDEYYIGETDGTGELTTQLPYCRYGGVILYSKEGYLGSGTEYDNFAEGITKRFRLGLWPLRNVTLTVRKRTATQTAALLNSSPTDASLRTESSPLNDTDLVVLNIERIKATPYDEDVPALGFYTLSTDAQGLAEDAAAKRDEVRRLVSQGMLTQQEADDYLSTAGQNATVPAQPNVTVQLAPGNYTIEAFLIRNGNLSIPEETREFCVIGGGSLCLKREKMTLNETNFTTWLSGGAALNASAPLKITPNTLYRFDAYTLYVLEQALPRKWEDLENYETPDAYLAGKRLLQLPTYG